MCVLLKESEELKEEISKTWKAVYKFRNCGKLFYIPCTLVSDFPIPTNMMVYAHRCSNGVYGYGDLQSSITDDSDEYDWERNLGSKLME